MPDLLSTTEACAYLHVTMPWLRRAILERTIPYHKLGRLVRFRRADLDAYLAAGRVEAAGVSREAS